MKKILLIDDDLTFIAAIKAKLDSDKYEIISAANGIEGLAKVEESIPDLILLDILMPKMDGLEFLKQLNEKYGIQKIPVLVTSNNSSLDKISEGIALGVRGYFIKSNESLEGISGIIDNVFKK